MYGYKCDKCGTRVNVDPGEERICDACLAKWQDRERQPVKIEYRPQKREACHAG